MLIGLSLLAEIDRRSVVRLVERYQQASSELLAQAERR
jgi:hypothetical protein